MFLVLDPGETTGFARFEQDGSLIDIGQVEGIEDLVTWINDLDPKPALIVYEQFLVDPHVRLGGSDLETVQAIGQIRKYGIENGIVAIPQSRTIKLIGYRWAGKKPLPKKRHDESHKWDALAHGIYYLVSNKIIRLNFGKEEE